MTTVDVARTILQQLGGGEFIAIVGARNIVARPDGVQFTIGEGAKNNINKVLVTLTPSDTYTVEFWTVRKASALRHEVIEDVYWDMLQDIFESRTGFFTTLHPRT